MPRSPKNFPARAKLVRFGMHLVDPFAILASYKPRSQANLKSCQGMNLFKMLDERTKHPVYQENMQAANTRVGNIKYKYKYKYKGG